MKKNKELIRSLVIASIFWAIFFYIFSIGDIAIFSLAQWQWLFVGFAVIAASLHFKLIGVNLERDLSDISWLSRLRTKDLSENMSALRDLSQIHPIAKDVDYESLYPVLPPELICYPLIPGDHLIGPIRKTLHGDYLALFDEVLGVLIHEANQCPAYFQSASEVRAEKDELDKTAHHLLINYNEEYAQTLMGDVVTQWRLRNLTKDQVEAKKLEVKASYMLRNHDGRSLLTHSLLVMAVAQNIVKYDKDPLHWGSFTRRYIRCKFDNYIKDDPLIIICALAHDLGKITAFNSATRDLSRHDKQGQQIVSRLPSYFKSTYLSQEDRFILDNVLGKYHSPSLVTVDLRPDARKNLIAYSRSNRMHRILEILIKADSLAGLIEGRAAEARRNKKLPQYISDAGWESMITNTAIQKEIEEAQVKEPPTPEEVVDAFAEIISDPNTLINPLPKQTEKSFGFYQIDIESSRKFLYLRVDFIVQAIREKLGWLPDNANDFITEILVKEGVAINPFTKQIKNAKCCTWFAQLYFRGTFIKTNKEGFEYINASEIREYNGDKTQDNLLGPLYMVDVDDCSDAVDKKLKSLKDHWYLYGLLVDGSGNGAVSPWKQGSGNLLKSRELAKQKAANGDDSKDWQPQTSLPSANNQKPSPAPKNRRYAAKKSPKHSENTIVGADDFAL